VQKGDHSENTHQNKNEKPMLYVKLKKALYGTLQAALLFWRLLSDTLMEWGFVLNIYHKCIANKLINSKQCTIIWHVDDLKISHVDKKVVNDIIMRLGNKFGKEDSLIATSKNTGVLRYDIGIHMQKQGKDKHV
jgi:hypothetical protein